MVQTYKILFVPVDPYFFGNEKNFIFPGQDQKSEYVSSYFIRSEKVPSQSTILGALRYIFLPYKWQDFTEELTENQKSEMQTDNDEAVGAKGFDVKEATAQTFGKIKRISPVFICGKNEFNEDVTLVPTPMDHNKKAEKSERTHKESKEKILQYVPFEKYELVTTSEGEKLYADDFDVKKGIEHSYVSLEKGEIYTEDYLFKSDLRIGINRSQKNDGFFKKEYCMLKKGFSFAVYADLETGNEDDLQLQYVFLGQGKSAFVVTFEKVDDDLNFRVESFLKSYKRENPYIYCLGDSFISDFKDEDVLFCALDTKDYRTFTTIGRGRVKKGGELYRLLKAGSIIIAETPDDWTKANQKANANNIGFNNFVVLGGNKNEAESV